MKNNLFRFKNEEEFMDFAQGIIMWMDKFAEKNNLLDKKTANPSAIAFLMNFAFELDQRIQKIENLLNKKENETN